MRAARRAGDRALWERLLAASPTASFFQTPAYAEIAKRAYGAETQLLAFECEDGARVALPVRRLPGATLRPVFVSPGRGLPGGFLSDRPLRAAHVDAVLRALARRAAAAYRLSFEPSTVPPLARAPERTLSRGTVHVLDLDGGFERVWRERVAGKVRNQCRKAERTGVVVAAETSAGAFAEFAGLHRGCSVRWSAAAREPRALFAACVGHAQGPGAPLLLLLARAGERGRAVAGALLARRGATWTYWLGAMDRGARELCPGVAVQRAALEQGCAAGARRYVLGASGGIASLEAFKASLGARAVPLDFALEVRGTLRELARRVRGLARPAAEA